MNDNVIGTAILTGVAIFGCGGLLYVIDSIARAADALERIADALEDDGLEDESEEGK